MKTYTLLKTLFLVSVSTGMLMVGGCGDDDDGENADSGVTDTDTDTDTDSDSDTDTDTDTNTDTDAGVDAGDDSWEWEPCPLYYDTPGGKAAECALIPVPLRWDDPGGPKIDIFVMRLPGAAAQKRGQIWLLEGGPGYSGVDYDSFMDGFSTKHPEWDVYTIDHRGVGRSARLGCQAEEDELSEWGIDISPDEWPTCLQSLAAEWGADLGEFTTSGAARDLGYLIDLTRGADEETFVYGCSYGTTWAHRYMQIFPEQATGVILDSLAIHIFFTNYDLFFNQVGEDFMEYCAADATCASKLGADPWATTGGLFEKIETGHCSELGIDRPTLRRVLGILLMNWWLRPFAPAVIYRLDRCEEGDISAVGKLIGILSQPETTYYDTFFSASLMYNIALSEFWPSPPPTVEEIQAIVDAAYMSIDIGPGMSALYDAWPRYPVDELWDQWADTELPVLMMNGDLDPQTPIWVAEPAEDALAADNHYFFQAPRAPHGVIFQTPETVLGDTYSTCGFKILMDFIDDPATEPDTACLENILEIDFEGNAAYSAYLFGESDMWENGKKGSKASTAKAQLKRPPGLDEAIRMMRRTRPL